MACTRIVLVTGVCFGLLLGAPVAPAKAGILWDEWDEVFLWAHPAGGAFCHAMARFALKEVKQKPDQKEKITRGLESTCRGMIKARTPKGTPATLLGEDVNMLRVKVGEGASSGAEGYVSKEVYYESYEERAQKTLSAPASTPPK